MIFVYVTFPNKKEAEKMAKNLLMRKLAACLNIFPVESIYSWRGKTVKDKEFVAIIKTKKQNFRKIEKFILKNHSYNTPCILEIPVAKVTKKYQQWLNKNL